ncbi:MAG: hypothetical protein HPY81_10075 [Firmicutes bacterium]|nr:hypothetical protein [Bacillota bacterium]
MRRKIWLMVVAVFLTVLCPVQAALAGMEAVYLQKVFDSDYKAIIVRKNGESYLIEYGVGVISLPFYEGKTVYIYSPGIFAGVGSKIIIPDRNQEAHIWDSELINTSAPPVFIPRQPILPPMLPQIETSPPPLSPPRGYWTKDNVFDWQAAMKDVFDFIRAIRGEPQPVIPQPVIPQPVIPQPEKPQPEVSQPEVSQPEVSQPEVSQPEVSQPVEPQPEVSLPEAPQSEVSQSEASRSKESQASNSDIPDIKIIRVYVNGVEVNTEVPAVIVNGRTLVPLRRVVEMMDGQVIWDEKLQAIGAARYIGGEKIKVLSAVVIPGDFRCFKRTSYQDGSTTDSIIIMDQQPIIVNGRTLVPVRFAAEALGASVTWDEQNRCVRIVG